MTARLERAFGYQGDHMNLPVPSVATSLPYYETVLGFRLLSRSETPQAHAVLVRDDVQIGLCENGGDPEQDGCAFHVTDLAALFEELNQNGLGKSGSDFSIEYQDGSAWNVFYVVAPDGLCFWFGERQS